MTDDVPAEVAEVAWKIYLFKSLRHLKTMLLHFPVLIARRGAAGLPIKSPCKGGKRAYLASCRVQL